MVLRKSFYIRWSAGRSPRVHEVNPGRDPSFTVIKQYIYLQYSQFLQYIFNTYEIQYLIFQYLIFFILSNRALGPL